MRAPARPLRLPTAWPGLLAWLALAIAALFCLMAAVQLLWSLLDAPEPGAPVQSSRVSVAAETPVDIAGWHLFGNGQSMRLRERVLAERRATELKLALRGTVARDDPETGLALIANAEGVERNYRVGDEVLDNVELLAVYPDHVLLDNAGSRESLALPRESLDAARKRAEAIGKGRAGAGPTGDATPIYVAPRMVHGKMDWQQARQQIAARPAAMLAELDIQPVLEGGKMRGIRLGSSGHPLAAAAGLAANDVVTAVNGVPLDSLARGRQLIEQLQGANHVDLTVLRNGQSQTISVDLEALR